MANIEDVHRRLVELNQTMGGGSGSTGGSISDLVDLAGGSVTSDLENHYSVQNGIGSIPVGALSFSISNAGGSDGTITAADGEHDLPPGWSLSQEGKLKNEVLYDASGTQFIVEYTK